MGNLNKKFYLRDRHLVSPYYVLDDTSDASKERVKKLFAILFDFDEVQEKWPNESK